MSEEEKKALEYVKAQKGKYYKEVVKLIEKQRKEIDEKTTILFAGAEKVKQLEKEIEERDKYNITTLPFEELKEKIEQNKNISIFGKEYISKDKISEKIEELEHQDFIAMQVVWKHDKEAQIKVQVLKKLLEGN